MIKCYCCGKSVPNENYCMKCGAKLSEPSFQRYAKLESYINDRFRKLHEDFLYFECFGLAKKIYCKKVDENDCTGDDVNRITTMTDDLYDLILKYKKSAKAPTNAD